MRNTLKLSGGKGVSLAGPIVDQARPSPTPTPAPDRWQDVKTEPRPTLPNVSNNPFSHPGKGDKQ